MYLRQMIRFGCVGAGATITYFCVTVGLVEAEIVRSADVASGIGMAAGFAVSYFGHHGFTFERRADHDRYFPRFLAAQISIFLLSSGFMRLSTQYLQVDYKVAALGVAVAWPLLSFILARAWVFKG